MQRSWKMHRLQLEVFSFMRIKACSKHKAEMWLRMKHINAYNQHKTDLFLRTRQSTFVNEPQAQINKVTIKFSCERIQSLNVVWNTPLITSISTPVVAGYSSQPKFARAFTLHSVFPPLFNFPYFVQESWSAKLLPQRSDATASENIPR
jgi:hypothetical protein